MSDPRSRKELHDALDEALEESFPGSDPIAVGQSDHAGTPRGHGRSQSAEVVDNEAQSRFELDVGEGVAVAYYGHEGDAITLLHTEVPQELSGRGIGSRLAAGVFDTLRARGAKVVAKCPFMARYAARHPEYAQMLVG